MAKILKVIMNRERYISNDKKNQIDGLWFKLQIEFDRLSWFYSK